MKAGQRFRHAADPRTFEVAGAGPKQVRLIALEDGEEVRVDRDRFAREFQRIEVPVDPERPATMRKTLASDARGRDLRRRRPGVR